MVKKIIAIWAEDKNGLIGVDGHLPWHLPAELQHFKARTMCCDVLMGRKSFDGMKRKALPGRQTFVLSHEEGSDRLENYVLVHSLEEALSISRKDLYVIGGAEVFKLFWDEIDEIYQTIVDGEFEGDTYFPKELSFDNFILVDETYHAADEKNSYDFKIKHWLSQALVRLKY